MRISDKFKLIKKVGSGAFGEIYKGKYIHETVNNLMRITNTKNQFESVGTNLQNGDEVAIKLEPSKTKFPQLYYEAKLYKIFNGAGKYYSENGDFD